MKAGDALRFIIGGGGGWGDPLARDVEKVAADVRNGLVSARAAELAYSVVIVDGAVVWRDVGTARRSARNARPNVARPDRRASHLDTLSNKDNDHMAVDRLLFPRPETPRGLRRAQTC